MIAGRILGWRPALRLARRDATRHRARTALIMLMVGLPVLLSSALITVLATLSIDVSEDLPGRLGRSQALIEPVGRSPIDQDPLQRVPPAAVQPGVLHPSGVVAPEPATDGAAPAPWTRDEIGRLAGGRLIPVVTGTALARYDRGPTVVETLQTAFGDPVTAGLLPLQRGRVPDAPDEIAISAGLAARGLAPGATLRLSPQEPPRTVVGVLATRRFGDQRLIVAATAPMPLLREPSTGYLLSRAEPVTWAEVVRLNGLGLQVLSREVVLHPPADQPLWQATQGATQPGEAAVIGLVVAMVVLQVVLMAGPAFAVGVRRRRRQLALIAAAGADQRQLTRIVLAEGVVLGVGAAALGTAAGIAAGFGAVQGLLHWRGTAAGPFELRWTWLAAAFAVGAASALLAALVPARQAARVDVVAGLSGRSDPPRRLSGRPWAAAALIAGGIGICLLLATRPGGEWAAALGTVLLFAGAIIAMPSLVALIGALAGRLPLPARLAARDASRHSSRSAPAAAAVMAAVAGFTALGIGGTSDEAQARRDYVPTYPAGTTVIEGNRNALAWAALNQAVTARLPAAELHERGSLTSVEPGSAGILEIAVIPEGCPESAPAADGDPRCLDWARPDPPTDPAGGTAQADPAAAASSVIGVSDEVADPETLRMLGYPIGTTEEAMLRSGGVLVPARRLIRADGNATVVLTIGNPDTLGQAGAPAPTRRVLRLRAGVLPPVQVGHQLLTVGTVMTPATARRLHLPVGQAGAVVRVAGQPLTPAQRDTLAAVVADVDPTLNVHTEEGFRSKVSLPLLVLAGVAALAVLLASLTATGLALADARADLTTLAAVGAGRLVQRLAAGAQAALIALLGGVLGVLTGAVPGLAVTWPLTTIAEAPGHRSAPVISIPWLLLAALVLAVPTVAGTAAAVFGGTRPTLTRRAGD